MASFSGMTSFYNSDELIKAFAESKLLLYEYGALDSVDHPDFQTEFYVMTSGLS